jgi:ribosomal protein S6
MKRYEGLFILNTAGREEGLKETIDKITAEITAAGAKVETVQKMDKRSFARAASAKVTGGFYLNVIFDCEPSAVAQLRHRLVANEEVFRVLLTVAPTVPTAPTVPAAPEPAKAR